MELNNIPRKGRFGEVVDKINANFDIIRVKMGEVEYLTRKNKGLFANAAALNAAIPSPLAGDWALVGDSFPVAIYVCETNGTWVDSEETYDGDSVDLNNYLSLDDFAEYQQALGDVQDELENLPHIENGAPSDLEFDDENGYSIVQFKKGHIITKKFDSSKVQLETGESTDDLDIRDEQGNVIVRFAQGHVFTKKFSSKELSPLRKVKILSIGNSFSYDAFSYVPSLLEEMGCDVTFGILYTPGCTLETHYSKIHNDYAYDAYSLYTTASGRWVNGSMQAIASAVAPSVDWDLVILQQLSTDSGNYETYQPHINNIINELSLMFNKGVEYGWLLTPTRPTESDVTAFFKNQIACAETLMNETAIEFVIPCGTAIANARTISTINNIADGDAMTYDGAHLQEGLPCLIDSYAAAMTFASMMGIGDRGVMGSNLRPTDAWIASKNIQGTNGSSVGVTNALCIQGQICAITAVKKPDEVTIMS